MIFFFFFLEKPLTQTYSFNVLARNHGIQREEISYTQPVRLPEQPVGRRRLQTLPRHSYVREQTTMNCVHTEVESDKQQLKCSRDYACKGCAQLLRL